MSSDQTTTIELKAGRFERFERIDWWDQQRLAAARVLVIGAGALGNEVIKNLALLGVGQLAIADMDRVEESNLARSILFRMADDGRPKAEVAAEAARGIFGGVRVWPLVGNVLGDVGLGWFRWADIVVGALDNREARVFVNSCCAQVGTPWIDGGIDVLNGIVRGFAPPETACYECTMGAADWDLLNKRRSCSLLARRAIQAGGTPTTPTTASAIGAFQAQEVVKRIHGLASLSGRGFVFEGLHHSSYSVEYDVHPECPWHEPAADVKSVERFDATTTLKDVWEFADRELGGLDAIDLSREIVESISCNACGQSWSVFQPANRITEAQAICEKCNVECQPTFMHSLQAGSECLSRSAAQIGLPPWDIVWPRFGTRVIGIEFTGDGARYIGKELQT